MAGDVGHRLERPVLAVDVVVLRLHEISLQALVPVRDEEPFVGQHALPGVAVRADELLLRAARRALKDKAGLRDEDFDRLYIEQLATFDALFRDVRGRTVSVAHLGLARPGALAAGSWRSVEELPPGSLPFDHDQVLQTALERLQGKLRYTNLASRLLPETFRMDELQRLYEAVLGRKLNRANLRTKLLRIGLIEQVGVLEGAVGRRGGRPPHIYRFTEEQAPTRDFI